MQDVTTLPFMQVISELGAPDYFFTEYFRVYPNSRLNAYILSSITENKTGRPVFAQLIGEEIPAMVRIAKELQTYPIAGIDLNMGCPAPKIYKKNVGGGLLRDPQKVDRLLGALRESIDGSFSIKMRLGFDSTEPFDPILNIIEKHQIDLVSIHGRTVKEMYRGEVHYDFIAQAKARLTCPVFANGNITSPQVAQNVRDQTRADGLMIGRSAIRNPWIFRQTREHFQKKPIFRPTFADLFAYIEKLWIATDAPDFEEHAHTNFMKKFLNFVGQSVDPEGAFLKEIRRTRLRNDLFQVCQRHLLDHGNDQQIVPLEIFEGLHARPNAESNESRHCGLAS